MVGDKSGHEAYEALWHAQDSAHQNVSVLASHSHFYMDHVFDTVDWKDKVLPGWISRNRRGPALQIAARDYACATRRDQCLRLHDRYH